MLEKSKPSDPETREVETGCRRHLLPYMFSSCAQRASFGASRNDRKPAPVVVREGITMHHQPRMVSLGFFAELRAPHSISNSVYEDFSSPCCAILQSRVLNWGIIGAMAMRAVMIVVGVAAIQRFR